MPQILYILQIFLSLCQMHYPAFTSAACIPSSSLELDLWDLHITHLNAPSLN